jgi:hypothetical protein
MRGIANELGRSVIRNPSVWILGGLLAASLYSCENASERLKDVCALAREGTEIATPTPVNPEATLRQVEMPSSDSGYILRELWRWQQLDGPQIEKACP